jgi:hypothetical protein
MRITHSKGFAADAAYYGDRSLPCLGQIAYVHELCAFSAPTHTC